MRVDRRARTHPASPRDPMFVPGQSACDRRDRFGAVGSRHPASQHRSNVNSARFLRLAKRSRVLAQLPMWESGSRCASNTLCRPAFQKPLNLSKPECSARGRSQRIPGRERIHVVSPTRNLPVFDADDRAEPVVVLHARREDRSVDLVFNDDMTIVRLVGNQLIGGLKRNIPDIATERGHSAASRSRATRPTSTAMRTSGSKSTPIPIRWPVACASRRG